MVSGSRTAVELYLRWCDLRGGEPEHIIAERTVVLYLRGSEETAMGVIAGLAVELYPRGAEEVAVGAFARVESWN